MLTFETEHSHRQAITPTVYKSLWGQKGGSKEGGRKESSLVLNFFV